MSCLFSEMRKHRVFREVYVGVIVAAVFFAFSFFTGGSSDGNWALIQQKVWNVTVCVSIVVIMGISRLFCYEDERGTDFLIGSAKYGRSETFFAKLMIAVAICFTAVLVFSALNLIVDFALSDPEMVEKQQFYSGSATDKMIQSHYYYDGTAEITTPDGRTRSVDIGDIPQMSNIAYYVLQYVFMFISYLYFAGFVMMIAVLTKKTAVTVVLSGITVVMSMYYCIIEYPGDHLLLDYIYRFSFGGYLFHDSFSWSTRRFSDVWKPVLICLAAAAAEFAILWLLWRRRARK